VVVKLLNKLFNNDEHVPVVSTSSDALVCVSHVRQMALSSSFQRTAALVRQRSLSTQNPSDEQANKRHSFA